MHHSAVTVVHDLSQLYTLTCVAYVKWAVCSMSQTNKYHVHVWVERAVSTTVEAESYEDAETLGVEQIKDELREEGIPLELFEVTSDEIVQA